MDNEKQDKRFPYSLTGVGKLKLDALRLAFNTSTQQATIDACIDDCYDRHYRTVIADAQALAEPENRIREAQRNARPQA